LLEDAADPSDPPPLCGSSTTFTELLSRVDTSLFAEVDELLEPPEPLVEELCGGPT
jgi:hypothetical protein